MSALEEKLKTIKPANAGDKQKKDTRFKPGQSGNPKGKPKGRVDYWTEMKKGIEVYAKENKMTFNAALTYLYARGFELGAKGEYSFFKDFMDRTHGKPVQPIAGPEDDDGNNTPILIKIDI